MDWQAEQLGPALEYDAGRMHHPTVVVIVPRRAGKSYGFGLVNLLTRATLGPRRAGWYTAHQREVGAALWRDRWFPLVEHGRLARSINCRRSNGSEAMTVRQLGSTIRLFAPDGSALRSQDADVVVVDEAREFSLEQGDALEAAVRPAQARRRGRQLVILSSAGTASSAWLRRYRDLGRAGNPNICYCEYAAPQGPDIDPYDPAVWFAAHPALASGDIDVASIAADAAAMTLEQFTCEYLGWWWDAVTGSAIDPAAWHACSDPDTDPPGPFVIGVDVTPSRDRAALVAAGPTGDGRTGVIVLDEGPGTAWLLPTIRAVRARYPGSRIICDGLVCAPEVEQLTRARIPVHPATGTELAKACATMLDAVLTAQICHRHQAPLDGAVYGAATRPLGDAWAWSRARSDVSIAPLVAATLAVWLDRTRPLGRPQFVTS
jgi:hypothetical protein